VTFGNRGLVSTYVALGIGPTLAAVRREGKPLLVTAFVLQITFVGVALTRGVWLAAGATIALFAFERPPTLPRSYRTWLLLTTMGVAVVAILALQHPNLAALVESRMNVQDWIANPRLTFWRAALEAFADGGPRVWLLGLGPGAIQALAPFWMPEDATRVYLDAHNDLLQLLVEHGSLVAFGVVAIIVMAGQSFRKAWREQADEGARAMLGVMTGLLASALFLFPLSLPHFLALLSWATLVALGRPRPPSPPAHGKRLGAAILAVALPAYVAHQVRLEVALRRYLTEPTTLLEKEAERRLLVDALADTPAPDHYRRLVAKPVQRGAFR